MRRQSCDRARVAWLGFAVSIACVQSGSVGSDTGQPSGANDGANGDDADVSTTASADATSASDGSTGADPYAVCDDLDTTGGPFPDSCTPSPDDHPCLQCIKLICCSELLSCPSFAACACQIDCAQMGAPPDVCNDACGQSPGGCDFSGCGELECEQVCVAGG